MQSAVDKIPSLVISRQLDQEKINFLVKRVEDLLSSNNQLRSTAFKNEKDTHDIVLYFQREMEMKDEIISRLNEELVKRDTQLKVEVEKMKNQYELELKNLKSSSDDTIFDLKMKLESAEADLLSVESYRDERDTYDSKLQQLEKSLLEQRQQLFDALDDQERKFLEEKAQILKDLDDQKLSFREIALKEARQAMGEEARKIIADNNRMREELKFHHSSSSDNQVEKETLMSEVKTLRRDIAILNEKDLEYAKKMNSKTKEIKVLRDRIEQLEKQEAANIEAFKKRTKSLRSDIEKKLEDSIQEINGLKQLLKLKNKELNHMKILAATILEQRSETEQFFLEALHEVKEKSQAQMKTINNNTLPDNVSR
eukprot:gene18387-24086_t